MQKLQNTQLSTPERPTGMRLQSSPVKLEAQAETVPAETEPTWHWCPTCKLASMKPAACPSCGTAYQVIPEAGIPASPHTPKVPVGRSKQALMGSLAGALALAGATGAGIFLLASHGASTVGSGTGSTGATVDGTSAFSIGALHGTLRLQGTWGASMQQVQLPSNITAGAKVRTVLSIGKGGEAVLVGSFQSTDPSSVLNQFVSTMPQQSTDAMGDRVTAEPSRDVSIAGYTAVAQDWEARTPKGGLLNRGTLYAVNAGDQVVFIRTTVAPTEANDLTGIEQALANIG